MNQNARLLGIVLCGGQSSRMGRNKAQLIHSTGDTFLNIAARRLNQLCAAVCLSGDPGQPTDLTIIPDPITSRGPAVGVAAAMNYAQLHSMDASLVTPIDMPFITVDDLLKLVDSWNATQELTIARSERLQPLLAVYPTRLVDSINEMAHSANRSLSHWLKSQDYVTVALSEANCRNLNTPEDLNPDDQ